MVALSEENVFSIHFLLSFHLVWCWPVMVRFGKNLDVVLYGLFWKWPLILVVFGIFCNVWVWLGWLGKNWMCVSALTCRRKERFNRHLFWLIFCVCRFFFLDCVRFHRCNICYNLCMGWSICLCERWFHSPQQQNQNRPHNEKQRWTHKRCTLMDPHTWPCKSRTTSSNVHSAAMWGYRMLSWRPT